MQKEAQQITAVKTKSISAGLTLASAYRRAEDVGIRAIVVTELKLCDVKR
jgi:hypothetical protein